MKSKFFGLVASKIVLLLLVILPGCVTVDKMLSKQPEHVDHFEHFLNSPDVNIYWNAEKSKNYITIYGVFQDNYYTDLSWVNLYVDLLDSEGKILKRQYQFFLDARPDQMLPFRVTFPNFRDAKRVRFSFDYNYAEWKSSVSNYGILESDLWD